MKKTTIIILTIIALFLLGALVAPSVLYKKADFSTNLISDGTVEAIEVEPFSRLTLDYGTDDVLISADGELRINIIEDDTVAAPVVELDKAWLDVVTIESDGESLSLIIDCHGVDEYVKTHYNRLDASDARLIANVIVPRGMLKKVVDNYSEEDGDYFSCEKINLEIRELDASELEFVNTRGDIDMYGGSIKSMTLNHTRSSVTFHEYADVARLCLLNCGATLTTDGRGGVGVVELNLTEEVGNVDIGLANLDFKTFNSGFIEEGNSVEVTTRRSFTIK